MRAEQVYSGSKSNLYKLTSNDGDVLLIEAGVTWRKILSALSYRIDNVAGCIISHSHKDHSFALLDVVGAGIDVYASEGTLADLRINQKRKIHILNGNGPVNIGPFMVNAYDVEHDATEPKMFIVRCDIESLLFATDTSHLKYKFSEPFDIIMLECSYDREVLQERVYNNTINESLAKRLLTSHMEKNETRRYLREFCDLSKCKELHLLHLSKDNIDAKTVRKEFEDELFIKTIIV